MKWRRWTWRLVVASPALLLLGFVGAGLTSAGTAQANDPVPCPSPTSLLSSATHPVCQTVQQVTGKVSGVTRTVSKAVTGRTGGSSGSTSLGGTTAARGSAASGSGAQRSLSAAQRQPRRTRAASRAAAGPAPAVGAVGPIGIPDWLLAERSSSPALNLPEVRPGAQRAAHAAKPSGRAAGRMWLLAALGAVGLVGVAGEHFLGWPGLRRRPAAQT